MDNEFISSPYSTEQYINLDMSDLAMDYPDRPLSNSMSPVPSAASTPPLSSTQSQLEMASFAAPVSLQQPYFSAYPRRAEQSYIQHNPYNTLGAPPPPPAFPKVRAPQLPTAAAIMQQQHQVQQPQPSSSDPQSSVEPDAPPSGTGGSRKRPKYTRSKKGCLTCRSKKIKCDERKPMCTRCEHGHRECTWPEAVLPRRPKGAVRGIGEEDDAEEDERRQSIPGSAVSTQFPSSATSTHFNSIPSNSPFEPAPPRRDVFEPDVYPNGSQFSMPVIPANSRPFYPRGPASAEFYPVTTVNGQPIDDYEFPPRQTFGAGSSSGSRSGAYSNNALYAGPPGAVPSYNGDLRRASWDSSAPTDGRRASWDANSMGAHASGVSSPASSTLGLGLGGISRAGGSSTGNNASGAGGSGGQGSSNNNNSGLMLFQSPDPLSPFFRSVQERNLVGNISSFSSTTPFSFTPSPYSSSRSSSSASSYYSSMVVSPASYDASTIPTAQNLSSSPVLSNASSSDFGITPEGVAYRKNSYPHLFPNALSQPPPLTIDPPVPIAPQGVDLRRPSVDLVSLAEKSGGLQSEEIEWLAPPSSSMDSLRPLSSQEGDEFVSWSAYS